MIRCCPRFIFLQQTAPPQRFDEITFDFAAPFFNDGIARDQNHIHSSRDTMLIAPEHFPQQSPRPRSHHRPADFPARDNAEPWRCTLRVFNPVQNQTAVDDSPPLRFRSLKIASKLDALLGTEPQRQWRIHENQTGVRRLRPTRRRLRKMARPLLVELRLRKPCCRLRRIFDG